MVGRYTVHIVGAGMAGLSTATLLAERGHHVQLYESAGSAGGRCRSFHDDQLGCVIDNGNHLMLSGNISLQEYITRIDAHNRLITMNRAEFPFMDLSSGERWNLDLGSGKGIHRLLMNGIARKGKAGIYGIPGITFLDVSSILKFRFSPESATVLEQVGDRGGIYDRLWEPLSIAILNTESESAMARAMWPVFRETLAVGPNACRPVLAKEGLSHALVDPAIQYLQQADAGIHFNAVLKSLELRNNRIFRLHFGNHSVTVDANDTVVLALPSTVVNDVLPFISTPNIYRPIVNAHFRVPIKIDKITIMGLINGSAQWVFVRNNIVSATVSAAQQLVEKQSGHIAATLWKDVCKALGWGDIPMGRHRIIKEKRATFAQTPVQNRRRSGPKTACQNLVLAGDWTATGLPATIEGAIRSGKIAADICEKTM